MADYLGNLQKQSQSYLSQLNKLQNEMKAYTPATASDALRDFSGRVGDLAPQYGELRGMESQLQQLPTSLMSQYLQQYGGTTGLDPMARLNAIQAQMGNVRGTTNVMRDVIGQQQNRLEQLANSAIQAYAQEQAGRQQQYANLNDMYKTILGQIEGEKSRRQAQYLAGLNTGGGGKQTTKEISSVKYVAPGQKFIDAKGRLQTAGQYGAELSGNDALAYETWLRQQGQTAQQGFKSAVGTESLINKIFNWNPMQGVANSIVNLFRR